MKHKTPTEILSEILAKVAQVQENLNKVFDLVQEQDLQAVEENPPEFILFPNKKEAVDFGKTRITPHKLTLKELRTALETDNQLVSKYEIEDESEELRNVRWLLEYRNRVCPDWKDDVWAGNLALHWCVQHDYYLNKWVATNWAHNKPPETVFLPEQVSRKLAAALNAGTAVIGDWKTLPKAAEPEPVPESKLATSSWSWEKVNPIRWYGYKNNVCRGSIAEHKKSNTYHSYVDGFPIGTAETCATAMLDMQAYVDKLDAVREEQKNLQAEADWRFSTQGQYHYLFINNECKGYVKQVSNTKSPMSTGYRAFVDGKPNRVWHDTLEAAKQHLLQLAAEAN